MRKVLMVAPVVLLLCLPDGVGRAPGADASGLWIMAALAQGRDGQRTAARMIARSGQKGRPVDLNIDIPDENGLRFARIVGVPQGFRFSRGFSLRDGSLWYVSASDLVSLKLLPPEHFVGVTQFYMDFFTLTGASAQPRNAQSQLYVLQVGEDDALASPAGRQGAEPTAAIAGQQPAAEREQFAEPYMAEAEALLRAQELLERRDVTAARLLFEDLALSGSAQGALFLARTFDPEFLRSIGAIGMQSDLGEARKWYQRAAELGNGEASQRLSELR